MTDQKLVDELEKALRDEAYDGGFGYMGDQQFPAYVRGLAVTAAKVVEEARRTECPQCHRMDGLHKFGCGEGADNV